MRVYIGILVAIFVMWLGIALYILFSADRVINQPIANAWTQDMGGK